MAKKPWLYCMAILGTVAVSVAHAQLEEIIVTAQKRAQSLQDVPISVQSFSGEQLGHKGLNDLSELSRFTPNLRIIDHFNGQALYMRGVGTTAGNQGFENAVAVFRDGVYTGRSRASLLQFLDTERVEVLRGPQPAFFGQNATAGALNIVTRNPGTEWQGYVNAVYGTDDEINIEAAFGGPVNDVFGIRGAIKYYQQDGWMDLNLDEQGPANEDIGGRVTLSFRPTNNFNVTAKAEWTDHQDEGVALDPFNCNQGPPATACSTALALGILDDDLNEQYWNGGNVSPGVFRTAANPAGVILSFVGVPVPTADIGALISEADDHWESTDRHVDYQSYSMTWNWEFGNGYTLTGTTGYYDYDSQRFDDVDETPIALFHVRFFEKYEQVSQEIRLSSPAGQTVDWLIGAYWQDSETRGGAEAASAWLGPLQALGQHFHDDARWVSAFASLTWNVTDRLRLNASGRYTDVSKEGSIVAVTGAGPGGSLYLCGGFPCGPGGIADAGSYQGFIELPGPCLGPVGPCNTDASFDDSDFSPQIGAEWDLNDNAMVYYKYTEAFKAGGFNGGNLAHPLTTFVFDSESVEAHEIGLKSEWLGGSLRFNAAIFTQDFSDLQVNSYSSSTGTFFVRNAASASTDGIEAELIWAATDTLTLAVNGAWLDAEFDEWDGAECSDNEAVLAPTCRAVGISRAGFDLPYASDWSTTISADYLLPLRSGFTIEVAGDVALSSDYFCSTLYTEDRRQRAHEIINLRIGLVSPDGRWSVSGYARNITDEKICLVGGPGTISGNFGGEQVRARGERFGVSFNYSFGD